MKMKVWECPICQRVKAYDGNLIVKCAICNWEMIELKDENIYKRTNRRINK